MKAAVPTDESLRLAKLHQLRILDTDPEEPFESIVTALSAFVEAPIALIVFVDSERQWFKAKHGLTLQETARDISFCAHTILQRSTVVSLDTTQDSRFRDNPLVTNEPNFKFYAASPIFFEGQPVGTVCCLDMVPRNFTDLEQVGLEAMARQVSSLLEARSVRLNLLESETRFSSLIDSMQDGLLVWNESCTIVLANKRASEIFSCDPNSLIGCGPTATKWDFFNDSGSPLSVEQHPAVVALREGIPQIGKIVDIYHRETDLTKSILFNCAPLFRLGSKNAVGVVTTLTAVTERKQMRVALEKLNSELEIKATERANELAQFFSVSMDLLCISDVQGNFVRVNPAFTSTLGWFESDLLGESQLDFVHPDDLETSRSELSEFAGMTTPKEYENRYRHKDGTYRTLWWKSAPLSNGLIYSAARDITKQRSMEHELRNAVEEAVRANAAKSEFLSRMSHELRTPMNAVLGYAQLLDLKYDDPQIRSATESILKGGNHLLQLINQVLDLSRIESGNLGISMEPVDLFEILDQTITLLAPTAVEAGVELLVNPMDFTGAVVRADRQRLLQILINIVGNGIKYNRRGGRVTFRCFEKFPSSWRLEIEDTGIGIPKKDRHLLFQPFQRFGDPGVEGSGLGLAISQRFASLMEGTLELTHSDRHGSVFALTLNRVFAEPTPLVDVFEESITPDPNLSAGTILYIEDNLSNIRLIESVLADWPNIKMIPAMQGSVGLELARNHKPDLILLDIHLPDLMGDQVLERLKSDEVTRDVPVVVLSADATKRQISASLEGGAIEYLTKPLDLKELYRVLQQNLPNVGFSI